MEEFEFNLSLRELKLLIRSYYKLEFGIKVVVDFDLNEENQLEALVWKEEEQNNDYSNKHTLDSEGVIMESLFLLPIPNDTSLVEYKVHLIKESGMVSVTGISVTYEKSLTYSK